MIGLLVFIRWDQNRLTSRDEKRPSSLGVPLPSAIEQGKRATRVCLGLALVFGSLAVAEWVNPSVRPFTGRFAFIKEAVVSALGERGIVALWGVAAGSLVLLAAAAWRRTPKTPTDGWLR